MALKTDYQNDELDTSVNEERTYNIVDANGNVLYTGVRLRETTVLLQEGSGFGKNDVNAITKALTDETANVSFQFGIDGNGDYGYIKEGETAVTPFKTRHTETFSPTSRAANLDMGLYHKKRYVDTTAVPNINTETQTISAIYTSGNGLDLGATNKKRYIKTSGLMVTPTGTKNITANGNNQDVLNYAKVNVAVNQTPSYYSINPSVNYTSTYYSNKASSSAWGEARLTFTGNPTVSKSGNTITISIPEKISVGGYNNAGAVDSTRTITITLTI